MAGRSQQFTEALTGDRRAADRIDCRARPKRSTPRCAPPAIRWCSTSTCAAATSSPRWSRPARSITDTIVERSNKVADTFHASAETLAASISRTATAFKDMLGARLQAFEDMFRPGRHRTHREDFARHLDARQPDHPPHRRIRPHREDLWRRTGREARPAHAGRRGIDADLCRHLRRSASPAAPRTSAASLDERLSQVREA